MFKIMIVDDEPAVRKGLSKYIDWETIGCEIVYSAKDGIDAEENLVKYNPDIVITDIKMPGKDGIDLAKEISINFNHIKTIILTGYSEFEYAQSAIKYNVVDFVLKPTDKSKLFDAVNRAKQMIIDQVEKNKLQKNIDLDNNLNFEIIQSHILRRLIYNTISKDNIDEQLKEHDLLIGNYIMASFEVNFSSDAEITTNRIFTIKKIIAESFSIQLSFVLVLSKRHICAIISTGDNIDDSTVNDIKTDCREIIKIAHDILNSSVSIGISEIFQNIKELDKAYHQSKLALLNIFFEESVLSTYEDFNKNLHLKISEKNTGIFINKIINFLEFEDPLINMSFLKRVFSDFQNPDRQNNDGEFNTILNRALEYIEEHYTEKITLDQVASAAHANKSYLSRLFSQKTGHSLTDAIAIYRINKAKQLLKTTDMKSYEVGEHVGISDPAYFSLLFKKHTGSSPSGFRNSFINY
jgi:two-component system, response regulator YesN